MLLISSTTMILMINICESVAVVFPSNGVISVGCRPVLTCHSFTDWLSFITVINIISITAIIDVTIDIGIDDQVKIDKLIFQNLRRAGTHRKEFMVLNVKYKLLQNLCSPISDINTYWSKALQRLVFIFMGLNFVIQTVKFSFQCVFGMGGRGVAQFFANLCLWENCKSH